MSLDRINKYMFFVDFLNLNLRVKYIEKYINTFLFY